GGRGGRKSASAVSVNVPATQGFTPDPKPFACNLCGAKYKSRPGLNYHRAHVHADNVSPSTTPQPAAHLLSPSIDVSTVCDLCLGDCHQNKKTMVPEQLCCRRASMYPRFATYALVTAIRIKKQWCPSSLSAAMTADDQLLSTSDNVFIGHPSCLKFTENMLTSTSKYGWQCIECKSCAICGFSDNDDQLLFCDDCDRGFHLYCLQPRLSRAPEGEWSCCLCQKEFGAKASLPSAVFKK
ncbi:unnamed protein product, partial [Gongylonema pulchrum]|uniref:PHD-type domain-containing protein n=1 Tax=Gongylonema pulchrum TaxID=637853 RepID=A0A183E0K7_9BILA